MPEQRRLIRFHSAERYRLDRDDTYIQMADHSAQERSGPPWYRAGLEASFRADSAR